MVGGGVIGLTVARRLALDGFGVTLVERGRCGAEASWAGAGVLAPCNPHRTDPVAELQLRSLAMHADFCAALRSETGIDPEYEPCGELELALDPDGWRALQSDAEAAGGRRMPDGHPAFQLHTPDETRQLEPLVARDVCGSLQCRETSQVRNPRLLAALRAACLKAGVDVRESGVVRDLIAQRDRVTGVRLANEDVVSAGTVVICAGAWSSQIDARLQTLMPVHPVRGQMILMKLDARPFGHILSRGKTYLVPRRDGHVLLGATEEPEAGFTKRNTAEGIRGLIERAVRLVPTIADAPLVSTWSGLRPGTPDDKPYIGRVPGLDGLIAATGHFRSGLTLAPATAEVVAAALQNKPYDLDLNCCRPGRF